MGIGEWLEEATPDRREVTVCFDRRLVSALVGAKDALKGLDDGGQKMLNKAPELKEAEAKVAELEAQVRTKSRLLVFEGIGWGPWRDLLSKHPPLPDQAETFNRAVALLFMPHAVENIAYNAGTFVPAAIAASCVDPGMELSEATRLLDIAPPGVIERVWAAVLEVNIGGGNDPFVGPASVTASGGAPASAKKSPRP